MKNQRYKSNIRMEETTRKYLKFREISRSYVMLTIALVFKKMMDRHVKSKIRILKTKHLSIKSVRANT